MMEIIDAQPIITKTRLRMVEERIMEMIQAQPILFTPPIKMTLKILLTTTIHRPTQTWIL